MKPIRIYYLRTILGLLFITMFGWYIQATSKTQKTYQVRKDKMIVSPETPVIDLAEYAEISFDELPKVRAGKYISMKKGEENISIIEYIYPSYEFTLLNFLSRDATYQGIEYKLGVKGDRDSLNTIAHLLTTDRDFKCNGFRIGDKAPDTLITKENEFLDCKTYIYKIPPTGAWGMRIDKDSVITEFWRLNKEGLTVDSIMASNRYP